MCEWALRSVVGRWSVVGLIYSSFAACGKFFGSQKFFYDCHDSRDSCHDLLRPVEITAIARRVSHHDCNRGRNRDTVNGVLGIVQLPVVHQYCLQVLI